MAIANNSVVSVHYELKDVHSGEVLDSNRDAAPLSFILGKGQIIPGLESEIAKLAQGEEAEIKVAAEDAYGAYDEEAVQSLPKEQFAGIELSEGMTLFGQGEEGQTVQVTVKSFNDESVEVDFNHPLAGKDLLFTVNITEVREATPDEILSGVVGGAMAGGCGCGTGGCGSHTHEDDSQDDCCGSHGQDHGGSCCGSH
jgi:FKBP-type peptidyl-prolyl cis-trans isomerase SlyD